MSWGVSWGESWGSIEVEETPEFGPWCVGGDDNQPKHTYGQHPFFRPIDVPVPEEVEDQVSALVAESEQVVAKKQRTTEATDEYWALQAYENLLRLEAERLANEAIAKAQEARDLDIAFVMMVLSEG